MGLGLKASAAKRTQDFHRLEITPSGPLLFHLDVVSLEHARLTKRSWIVCVAFLSIEITIINSISWKCRDARSDYKS